MYRIRKTERNKIIVMLINKGLTYVKIGKIFNITSSRVKDINKVHNCQLFKDEAVKCVNCGLEAYGDFSSNQFLFGDDPINVCMPCVRILQNDFIDKKLLTSSDINREKIRVRDNYTCQICGKVWIFGQRRFDVHHIDCNKEKTYQYDNYEKEKDNMITLCHKCHLNIPEHRKTMSIKRLENLKPVDKKG